MSESKPKGKARAKAAPAKEEKASEKKSASPSRRSARSKTEVNRLIESSATEGKKKEVTIPKGKGTPLGEIPHVSAELDKAKYKEIVGKLHTAILGRGKKREVRGHLRLFSGLVYDDDSTTKEAVQNKFKKWTVSELKEAAVLLGVHPAKNKEQMIDELITFLESPKELEPLSKRLTGKKRTRKSGSSKKGATKKKAAKKAGDDADGEDEDEDEEEEEEEDDEKDSDVEPPKKKQKRAAPKKSAAKKTEAKDEEEEDEEGDDESSEVKKKLKKAIEEIYKNEAPPTWKALKKALAKEFDSETLTTHKQFIKNYAVSSLSS